MNIKPTTYSPALQTRNCTASRRGTAAGSQSKTVGSAACSQDTVTISARTGAKAVSTKRAADSERVQTDLEHTAAGRTMLPDHVNLSSFAERVNRYRSTIEDYYAKRNEENKKFPDPQKHIWRKYWDRNYKYYEKGLTESEREWSCKQEWAASGGHQVSLSPYDPAILKAFGGPGNGSFPLDDALNARKTMNEALNRIFKENGIVVPDGADLRFTIDPYDCQIKVSGADEKLTEKIEAALNTGNNGYNLYSHISWSNPGHYGISEEPPQYSRGNPWKTSLFLAVKESTGYDLRELERKDGQFLTPDGENVWDLLDDKYKIDSHFYTYRLLAGYGWDCVEDQDLSIGYKEGSLYDLDTAYGYGSGQTAWIDQRREEDEADQRKYMKEREETLRREESMPNRYERAFASQYNPDGTRVNAAPDGSYAGLFPEENQSGGQVSLFDYMNQGKTGSGLIGEILKNGVTAPNSISAMLMAQMSSALKSGKGALAGGMLGTPGAVVRRTGLNRRV
ncbi:MAG: DUF4885 family protein [Lachnospiraceae bacterium]|nr:DUF4885 family protein [Lachnospiraceae bacterium]